MRYSILLIFFLIVGCSGIPAGSYHSSIPTPTAVESRPAPLIEREARSEAGRVKEKPYPVLSKLFKATVTFILPRSGNIDSILNAQLVVQPGGTIGGADKAISTGNRTTAQVEISRKLHAQITATDFDVTPVTPETQLVAADKSTEWLWELHPKKAGIHQVKLTVTAIVKVDGESSEHYLKKFEEVVTVEVHPVQVLLAWLSKYWQWLVSTLVLPFLLWVYKKKFNQA